MKRSLHLNPLNQTATWQDIKAKRETLKRTPITTSVGTFDVDDISFKNITTAIDAFAAIEDSTTNTVTWKLEDNTQVAVTLTDLQNVRNAVAVRANTLHYYAEVINAGTYLVKDLDNLALWGL